MSVVSIVVPVYNAAKYLNKCVESLLNQTLKDIEIIFVNDGSSDSSSEILDNYAGKDSRIIVINKSNEGVAKARKDGVLAAKSKYVCFVDSDDFVADNYCEAMFLPAKELNADLVECGYNECRRGKSKANLRCLKDEVLNKAEFTNKIFKAQIVNGTESVVVWGKLYLRDTILNNIEDYGRCPLEDYYFNMQYYRQVERYAYVSQCLYNYNITDNSLSRSFNKSTYFVLKEVQPQKERILKSCDLFSDGIKEECAFWYCRYTENYLKNSPKVFDENQLFYEIVKDEELCKQANIIRDKNKFASYIAGGRYRSAYYYVRRGAVLSRIKRCVKRIIRR